MVEDAIYYFIGENLLSKALKQEKEAMLNEKNVALKCGLFFNIYFLKIRKYENYV